MFLGSERSRLSVRSFLMRAGAFDSMDDERAFFRMLRMRNGTYKTTDTGRMRDLDRVVAEVADFGDGNVLDVGISSGRSTAELLSHLEGSGRRVSAIAVDLALWVTVVALPFGVEVALDSAGEPIQVAYGSHVRGRPVDSPGTLLAPLKRWGVWLLAAIARGRPELARGALVVRELAQRERIDYEELDISVRRDDWRARFHLVRAANILNRAYFGEEKLRLMLNNLLSYVSDGGLLVVCRTHEDGTNHATVFRKNGDGSCGVLVRMGDGSEVAALVPMSEGSDSA